jgi:RNA polymerase sigma-70 factor (ECF subfamily)
MASRAAKTHAAAARTFEELYRGHHAEVFRAALRELGNVHDAEDVTQAAFVDAYRAVLHGTEPQSPRAWLLAISENVRRRRFRTAQRRPRELPLDADSPLAADLPTEQAHALAEGLAALPTEQRRVFVLREIAGRSYDEIADEVDATVASVQMLLFRARRSLREQLDPPVVAPRRTGVLVPIPGWLTGLASRFEIAGLTPRVAGSVGAAVLAVVGASVAVPQAPADGVVSPPTDSRPRAASVTSGAVARPAAHAVVAQAATSAPPLRLRAAPPARRPPSPTPASSSPPPAAAPEPASLPELAATPTASAPAPTPAVTVALPPVALPVTVPLSVETEQVVPALTVPGVPAAPPLPAPVPELTAGAAGAAGASAPPLPVEVPPLPALPPAP